LSFRTILIVDDDDEFRHALGDLLGFEGFETYPVRHGQEALAWLRAHPQRSWLVLLDMMMPIMDGEAFLRAKECDPALADIPVIVLTAGGDCRELLSAPHNLLNCFPKTVPLAELLGAIEASG